MDKQSQPPFDKKKEASILTCGIVMPISSSEGYTKEHWLAVKEIICEAVESISEPKFETKLVS